LRCVHQKRTPSVLFHRFVHQVDEESDTEDKMNKDGQIKPPPSVGVHVFGFIAYSAPLSILPRRHFCNKHEVYRQKMRRRFAKSPKFHAPSKGALHSACRTVGRPSRLARAAPPLRGFGLDRLPTARRINRQAPMVEKRTEAFVFLRGTNQSAACVVA
jgi:hypothetical protein